MSFKLVPKVDYYLDASGNMVFTAKYLAQRGKCCGSGCRHCPYDPFHAKGSDRLAADMKHLALPR